MGERITSHAEHEPSLQEHFRQFVNDHETLPHEGYKIDGVVDGIPPVDSLRTHVHWLENEPSATSHILTLRTSAGFSGNEEDVLDIWVLEDDSFWYRYGGQEDIQPLPNTALVDYALAKYNALEAEGRLRRIP